MRNLQVIEVRGIRVLTTRQLAEAYEADVKTIQYNFRYNKTRYILGKHYIEVEGDELRRLKTRNEFQSQFKYAKSLYLWTEKGALLHAKSLNTDKAWEVYDYLVDFYFQVKEEKKIPATVDTKPVPVQKEKNELPYVEDPISAFRILLEIADARGLIVKTKNFECVRSALKGNRIGIRSKMLLEEVVYELAWELSHSFIHYDNGDMINSSLSKDYNEQATRSADMIIKLLNVKMNQM